MRLALCLASLLGFGFVPPVPSRWEKTISPGVTYRMEVRPDGPLVIHAVRMTPNAPDTHLKPVLAGNTVFEEALGGRTSVSRMAQDNGALVAINGDFFLFGKTPNGDPLGLMVAEGDLLSTPFQGRAVFAWGPSFGAFSAAKFEGKLTAAGIDAKLDGVNGQCGLNEVELYTTRAGMTSAKVPNLTIVLNPDTQILPPSTTVTASVESISRDQEPAAIPDDRWVIVAHGTEVNNLASLTVGSQVTISLKTTGFDWLQAENAIGGGPMLVQNGQLTFAGAAEKFPTSFTDVRHPRTAIGRTADGDIWLVVVDGRSESSSGCTLAELAQVMLDLGCANAMNLDGGGSTTMTIQGLTVNHPSDGTERAVANGIVILAPRPTAALGSLRVLFMPDQRAKAAIGNVYVDTTDVIWATTGPVSADQGGHFERIGTGPAMIYARAKGLLGSAPIPEGPSAPAGSRRRVRRRSSRLPAASESTPPAPAKRRKVRKSALPQSASLAQTATAPKIGPKTLPATSAKRKPRRGSKARRTSAP